MAECEENSCNNFQSAICLHCMHRLCTYHIENHQKVLLNEVEELKNEVNQVNIDLVNASNTMMEERKVDETKCTDWRKQKIAEIECEYSKMISSISTRRKTLEQLELQVNQRLKIEVQQPLEQMHVQESISPQLLKAILLSIETIRRDTALLIWNSQEPNNINNSSTCNDDKEKASSSITPKVKRSKENKWKPRNLLCPLFRNVGPDSVRKINEFVQTMMKDEDRMENNGLITLVFSYLQTWHGIKIDRGKYKQSILNKHISTVKRYVTGRDCERQVLIALEFFYNNLKHNGPTEVAMMTMLLQLFFDHQCISMPEIIDRYLNKNLTDEIYGKKTIDKRWAEPFLSRHGYQIKSTNPTSNEVISTTSISSETPSASTQNASTITTLKIPERVPSRKPYKKLVNLFKNSSGTNDVTIHQYIEKQYGKNIDYRVIMIVRCYLKAWNECASSVKDEFLLNNVLIIKYYKYDPHFEMQILFAIEIFLSQNTNNEIWSIETISTLFQFFFDQNCIKKETFLNWNSDDHIYYKETKGFAQPFIQRLTT